MSGDRKFDVLVGGKDGQPKEPVVTTEDWKKRKKSAELAVELSVRQIGEKDFYSEKRAVQLAMTYASYSLDLLRCDSEIARRPEQVPLSLKDSRTLAMLELTIPEVSERGEYGGLHTYLTQQAEFFKHEADMRLQMDQEEAAQVYFEAARNIDTLNRILPPTGDPIPKPEVPWGRTYQPNTQS